MQKKGTPELKDNRMVNDNHQQGISRKVQRGPMQKGPGGCMSWKGESKNTTDKGSFKQDSSLTPRRA